MSVWWFNAASLRHSVRRLCVPIIRVLKWWLKALERRPLTGVLALGVLAVGVGVALRVVAPEGALVVSAFEVPESARTRLGVSGKTMANVLLDAFQRILDSAAAFNRSFDSPSSGGPSIFEPLIRFAMRAKSQEEVRGTGRSQPEPLRVALAPPAKAPPVGVEVEGFSVERLGAEWNRLRQRQTIVSGDVLATATGIILRARISATKGVWEVGPVTPTLHNLDRAASDLALRVLTEAYPAVAQRYCLSLGLASQKRGRLRDALNHYRRAVAVATRDPYAALFLGVALLQVRKADSAVATLNRAILSSPQNADLRFIIGSVLQRDGQLQEATRILEGALNIDRRLAGAQFNLALAYSDQGMIPEAKAAWLAYLANDTRNEEDDGDAWNGLAWMYYQRGLLSDAAPYSDSSLNVRSAPSQKQSYLDTRANIWLDSGNPEKALEVWNHAAAASSKPVAYHEIGKAMALLELGRTTEAIAAYRRGIKADHRYGDTRYLSVDASYSAMALARLGRLRSLAKVPRSTKH